MKIAKACLISIIVGAALGFLGVALDRFANTRETSKEMYFYSNWTFPLQIPGIPGLLITLQSSHRDWLFDEDWETYLYPIVLWNAAFYGFVTFIYQSFRYIVTPAKCQQNGTLNNPQRGSFKGSKL